MWVIVKKATNNKDHIQSFIWIEWVWKTTASKSKSFDSALITNTVYYQMEQDIN